MPNQTIPPDAAGLPSNTLATLRPIGDPIARAIWKLTALNLIIGQPGMFVDEDERNVVEGLVSDALDLLKDAREKWTAAWETIRCPLPAAR